jgi:hypothetical protein
MRSQAVDLMSIEATMTPAGFATRRTTALLICLELLFIMASYGHSHVMESLSGKQGIQSRTLNAAAVIQPQGMCKDPVLPICLATSW